ncbi:MAG: Gfo/Idh/MocA family protein [Gemmatimonadaceae bacterium]
MARTAPAFSRPEISAHRPVGYVFWVNPLTSGARVRVALIGCGRIARLAHLEVLRKHPRADLVGIADTDSDARTAAAVAAPSAAAFADYHELLASLQPDAVVIATPTDYHLDATLASLESGANIYLEKPIAGTIDHAHAAHAAHDAWLGSGRVGRIGFNCRFNRLYRQMKELITDGAIGELVAARTALTAKWPDDATWRLSPGSGGGAVLELASHHIDLLRFIFNTEVQAVSAMSWSNRGDDEASMIQLRLRNGLHAQTLVSYGTREEDSFEVLGSKGKLSIDRYDSLVVDRQTLNASGGLSTAVRRMKSEAGAIRYGREKQRSAGQEPSFSASISDFIEASIDGSQAKPDLLDGLRAFEVADAARVSARERRIVELRIDD